MAQSSARSTNLPEPAHPFARWLGVTVIGLWAVGAQSFPEPFSKLIAILSPGVGYIVGHSVDRILKWTEHNRRQRSLIIIDSAIIQLNKEKADAEANGRDKSIITVIDMALTQAIRRRVNILAAMTTD